MRRIRVRTLLHALPPPYGAFGRHHSSRTCSSRLCSQPRGADDGRTCGRGAFVTTAPAPNHFSGGRPLSGRSDLIVRAMRPDDVETLASIEGRVEESPWSAGNFLIRSIRDTFASLFSPLLPRRPKRAWPHGRWRVSYSTKVNSLSSVLHPPCSVKALAVRCLLN